MVVRLWLGQTLATQFVNQSVREVLTDIPVQKCFKTNLILSNKLTGTYVWLECFFSSQRPGTATTPVVLESPATAHPSVSGVCGGSCTQRTPWSTRDSQQPGAGRSLIMHVLAWGDLVPGYVDVTDKLANVLPYSKDLLTTSRHCSLWPPQPP